jgi:tRNA (mo5U34)-methyltransferase
MALKDELEAIPHWYHRIALPGGLVTPGWAPLDVDLYRVPADLTGKRVLDVGAWDGFWSFEALKRGAREVVAIDDFSNAIYKGEQRGWKQFDFCRDALGYTSSQCSRQEMSVYDVTRQELGQFRCRVFLRRPVPPEASNARA